MENLEIVPGRFIGPTVGNGGRDTGDSIPRTFVIAEIGQNHNGDVDLAKRLIQGAKEAGADCVKFQKSNLSAKFTQASLERAYNSENSYGSTYGEHKGKLELSEQTYGELMEFAKSQQIPMTASAMDLDSIDFLVNQLKVPFIKIGSGDSNNPLVLQKVAKLTEVNAVVSTGMCNAKELNWIVQMFDANRPQSKNFVIMHCTSGYPTPSQQINLRVIGDLRARYPHIHFGYSGHELGYAPTLGAVALGARVVERHITLDKRMKGTDHKCSLDLTEFKQMVQDIRCLEESMGGTLKAVQPCEIPTIEKLGKSLVFARAMPKGQIVGAGDLCVKVCHPHGFRAQDIETFYGRELSQDVNKDEPVSASHVLHHDSI